MNKKQKKRAATAGAVVMMLGVLHLSTKDASGAPTQCEIGHSNPPVVGPCDLSTTPPSTVVFEVTPYKPGEPTLAPPVMITAPPTTTTPIDPCGDFSTKDICSAYQAAHPPVAVDTPAKNLAQGCSDEHYDDGSSEVICDTNGVLPGPPLPVKHVATSLALPATE